VVEVKTALLTRCGPGTTSASLPLGGDKQARRRSAYVAPTA